MIVPCLGLSGLGVRGEGREKRRLRLVSDAE